MRSYNDLGEREKKKKRRRREYQDRYSSEIRLIFHVNPISGYQWSLATLLEFQSFPERLAEKTWEEIYDLTRRGLILFGRYDAEVATLETHSGHTWSLDKPHKREE